MEVRHVKICMIDYTPRFFLCCSHFLSLGYPKIAVLSILVWMISFREEIVYSTLSFKTLPGRGKSNQCFRAQGNNVT